MSRLKTFFRAIPALYLVFLLFFGFFLAFNNSKNTQKTAAERLGKDLNRLALISETKDFLAGVAKEVFQGCLGHSPEIARSFIKEFPKSQSLPPEMFETFLFDRDQNLLTPLTKESDTVRVFFSRLHKSPALDLSILPLGKQTILRFLLGPFGYSRMDERPNRIFKINIAPRRTWAIWQFIPATEQGKVAGILLFFNKKFIPRDAPAIRSLKNLRSSGKIVDFFDPSEPSRMPFPNFFEGLDARKFLVRFLTNSLEKQSFKGNVLAKAIGANGVVFVGLVPAVPPVFSGMIIGLGLLVFVQMLKTLQMEGEQEISLKNLMGFLILFSGGMPLIITFWLWRGFQENRLETVTLETLSTLEDHLINIDSTFPTLVRKKRAVYRKLFSDLKSGSKNLNQTLIKLRNLELKFEFDSVILIGSHSQELGNLSQIPGMIRRIALLSPKKRLPFIQEFTRKGFNFNSQTKEFLLNFSLTKDNIDEFRYFSPQTTNGPARMLARHVGGKLMADFNQSLGIAPRRGKPKVSSLVMESIMDSQTNVPIEFLNSMIGDFFQIGPEDSVITIFFDILPDDLGRANYCAFLFHYMENLEFLFWRSIFGEKRSRPRNLKYFAVTQSDLTYDFPRLDLFDTFRDYERRLKPPRRILSEVVQVHGKKYLFAAMACRNLPHYLLTVLCPFKVVEEKVGGLNQNMWIAGTAMFFMLLILGRRLSVGILRPAEALMRGIQAMDDRNYTHRIPTATNDEWDDLAETFNITLNGMQEWELAGLVQTHCFPQKPIANGPLTFQGKFVSASHIGGDFFDAYPVSESGLAFIFGDVSGHSVSAALVVGMVKAAFGCIIKANVQSPAIQCTKLNSLLFTHLRRIKVMTCIAGSCSIDGKLQLVDAGHIFPFLLTKDGKLEVIKQIGLPLGASQKKPYKNLELVLPPESRLIMVTDGILEAINKDFEPVGFDRLESWVREFGALPPDRFFSAIFAELKNFTGTDAWQDDASVALLEFNPSSQLPRN